MIKLPSHLLHQVEVAAAAAEDSVDDYVAAVLTAHFDAKLKASMPRHKDIIIANVGKLEYDKLFVVTDIMDSIHRQYPKERRTYGQILALLIARRTVPVEFTGKFRGTYKVYRKTR